MRLCGGVERFKLLISTGPVSTTGLCSCLDLFAHIVYWTDQGDPNGLVKYWILFHPQCWIVCQAIAPLLSWFGDKASFCTVSRAQWSFLTCAPPVGVFPAERRVKMCWRLRAWRPLACCRVEYSLEAGRHYRVVRTSLFFPSTLCFILFVTFLHRHLQGDRVFSLPPAAAGGAQLQSEPVALLLMLQCGQNGKSLPRSLFLTPFTGCLIELGCTSRPVKGQNSLAV